MTALALYRPRRSHRFRLFGALAALVLTVTALAGCGDDDDGADAGAGGSTTAGPGGSETTAGNDAEAGDVGTRLIEALGLEGDDLAGDVTFDIGAVLALTGSGSYYGETMQRGIELAVKHIEAAGGTDFNVIYYDHKSGDPQAGLDAITDMAARGVAAKLASFGDDLGVMIPGTEEHEIFTMDGGAGAPTVLQGKPFYWGPRAIYPNDMVPGLLAWAKETYPDAQTVGLVGLSAGEPNDSVQRTDLVAAVEAAGFEFNGLYELTTQGELDFSDLFPKIQANEPDILVSHLYGQEAGAFTNQLQTAGLSAQVLNFDFTTDGLDASRGAYEDGFIFASDYFDPDHPTNPLAELFVEDFRAEYGLDPDIYAANYYENTIGMWELIRRVLADGGELTGAALDAALRDNPTLPSVYGGDESTPGTYTFDLETHALVERGMGVFRYEDGTVTPLAFFNIGGADLEIVAE